MPERLLCSLAACFALLLLACSPVSETSKKDAITVFAASSTTQVMESLAARFTEKTGTPVSLNLASSSVLARQIQAGAPAQLFLSANPRWMDVLEDEGVLKADTRTDLLGNRLALIGSVKNPPSLAAGEGSMITPYAGKLSVGDPDHVPAGTYAKVALEYLGEWDALKGQLVVGQNVRVALNFVVTGEVPLGIVYATDAAVTDRVYVLALFPEQAHPPIRYPVALLREAGTEAEAFLQFLKSAEAAAVFEQAGFTILTRPNEPE